MESSSREEKIFNGSLEPIADDLARVWRQMSDREKRKKEPMDIFKERKKKGRKEKLTAL